MSCDLDCSALSSLVHIYICYVDAGLFMHLVNWCLQLTFQRNWHRFISSSALFGACEFDYFLIICQSIKYYRLDVFLYISWLSSYKLKDDEGWKPGRVVTMYGVYV